MATTRYQIPVQLLAEEESTKIPLMQLMAFGAAGGGRWRDGQTITFRVLDFSVPGSESNGLSAEGSIFCLEDMLPVIPLLRMTFEGHLQVISLRGSNAKQGGPVPQPSITVQMSSNGNANPLLELYLDCTTLSTRPIRIIGLSAVPFVVTSTGPPVVYDYSILQNPAMFSTVRSCGDVMFIAPTGLLLVVQGSWIDLLMGRCYAERPNGNTTNGTPLMTPNLRFAFVPSPMLARQAGTSTGAGSPIPPLPITFPRVSSQQPLPLINFLDISLNTDFQPSPIGPSTDPPVTNAQMGYAGSGAPGATPGGGPNQLFAFNTYQIGAAVFQNYGAVVNEQPVGVSDPSAVWLQLLGYPGNNTYILDQGGSHAAMMYLGWCPETRRSQRTANLLIDAEIV